MLQVGDMRETEKTAELKQAFLAAHPAAFYVEFEDFKCFALEVCHDFPSTSTCVDPSRNMHGAGGSAS